jgi:peroxidase
MHTVWLREHNRIARDLALLNPKWDDETLFQEAKRITTAEYQHLTYAEYLPVILGEKIARLYGLLPLERGYFYNYEAGLYPQVANEFSFAMRFCHTLVPLELSKANKNYVKLPPKVTGYFIHNSNLTFTYPDMGLIGSIREWSYYPSPQINYDLNNYLFDGLFPDSKRFSLPAINIQRSRDHGVPGYNYYRELCGLNYANVFEDLYNIPPYVIARLKSVYAHPNDIDLWTGMVSEYPVEGATFGATAACKKNYLITLNINKNKEIVKTLNFN